MALRSDDLKRVEGKIDRLLRRKQQREAIETKRRNQRVSQLGDQIKQLKVEKISLLTYIRELETALKVQRADDKDL